MTLDALIDGAWDDHADAPGDVAERLAQGRSLLAAPADIPPFARIVTHVYGEHLARWDEGAALLESLRETPAWDGSPPAAAALERGIAVLRYCGGAAAAVDPLPVDERIAVLATAASALVAQHACREGIAAYRAALALAPPGLTRESPAARALAAGGNNLAVALEEKPDRDAFEARAMLDAARAGLEYWKIAGTWLEEERAEFRLSSCLRAEGDYEGAMAHARRCVAVCDANTAPPFERFFGVAAFALAQRDAGLDEDADATLRHVNAAYAAIPAAERRWCETLRAALALPALASE